MSRVIEYSDQEVCDWCGSKGAFDFFGDCICPDCMEKEMALEDKEELESLLEVWGPL